MAKVNLTNKKANMELWEIIKFQILTHCYIENIHVNDSDLNCLTLISALQSYDQTELCKLIAEKGIFKSDQTVRNCLVKLQKSNLIIKVGKSKKTVMINPDLKIQTKGNILLDYKFLYVGPKET